jgi:hypothetical protein
MYYTKADRNKEILEFVKRHPRIIKTKVLQHMAKKRMGQLMTIQPLLVKLIDSGKIIILKDKPNSRIHRLLFNYDNEFNKIDADIYRLKQFAEEFFMLAKAHGVFKRPTQCRPIRDKALQDFMRLTELNFYERISWIVIKIKGRFKSVEDYDELYHRLTEVLLLANKVSSFLTSSNEMIQQLEEIKQRPQSRYFKFFNEVTKLTMQKLT